MPGSMCAWKWAMCPRWSRGMSVRRSAFRLWTSSADSRRLYDNLAVAANATGKAGGRSSAGAAEETDSGSGTSQGEHDFPAAGTHCGSTLLQRELLQPPVPDLSHVDRSL